MTTDTAAERADLLAALIQVQNHPAHSHHDIVTITYCAPAMTCDELRRHLDWNMELVARWSDNGGKTRRRRAA